MSTIHIQQEVDRFVLYFDTPRAEINAYALASSLVNLSDAIREANSIVNPGYRVEVVVEALTAGSFTATVRTVFNKIGNLFSSEAAKAIIYGIIATHIYETVIKTDVPPKITVTEESVIVESGKNKIIVPKTVYEAKKQLDKSDAFRSSVGKMFASASSDETVRGIGIGQQIDKEKPPIYVPRDSFSGFDVNDNKDENSREIIETATLIISRAILERGNRKWEFYWRGVKISAPVLDNSFYTRFFDHEITIAPGDALNVALRILQEKKPDSGIYVNKKYEVIEVIEHIPRMKQGLL